MSISGLVIHARPEEMGRVRAELNRRDGVQIHGESADGRMVVTVDRADDVAAAETISGFQNLQHVFSVSLVYSHFDDIPADKEQADESIEA
jgi:nitrate reductase NapD